MCVQNLKFAALLVPEIIGVPPKLDSPWIRPRSLYSKILKRAFVRMDPVNVLAKFEVRSFTRSWDRPNSDWSFAWWLRTPNLGEEEAVGGGDSTVRKSVGELL